MLPPKRFDLGEQIFAVQSWSRAFKRSGKVAKPPTRRHALAVVVVLFFAGVSLRLISASPISPRNDTRFHKVLRVGAAGCQARPNGLQKGFSIHRENSPQSARPCEVLEIGDEMAAQTGISIATFFHATGPGDRTTFSRERALAVNVSSLNWRHPSLVLVLDITR